jgi:hypothetical protein
MNIHQKAQIVTEPIEAKTLFENPKSQNQSYLENRIYKTISFTKNSLENTLITNLIVSETSRSRGIPKLNAVI